MRDIKMNKLLALLLLSLMATSGWAYDKTDLKLVDVAGNVYNRLILFNAQAIHAASEYFGDSKENSRLFQIFFFDAE